MKNVTIKNKQNQIVSDLNLYENPTDFINHIVYTNYWGKPERWVRQKMTSQDEYGDAIYIFPDEQYEDEDVIDEKQSEEQGEFVYYVQLKAEYAIEINDYNPVPQSISPAQARLALVHAGLYQSVQDTVAVATDEVKIYWDYATVFERNNPILTSMASAIGIDSDQLDDLFRLGVTL